MIVRNNTSDTLYRLEAVGIARDTAGTLVASGSSQGFEPTILKPGEWAMGYVYFDIDALSGDETFEWQTQSDTAPGFLGTLELTISEAELTSGDFGQQVVGIVNNDNTESVTGPNSVYVGCFDGPNLLGVDTGFTDGDEIRPGGFSPFTVDLYSVEACPALAIAASGFNF